MMSCGQSQGDPTWVIWLRDCGDLKTLLGDIESVLG